MLALIDCMTKEESNLWDKIRTYEIGVSNADLSFSDRLARENGWSLKYSLRTIHEYKRFIFLVCISQKPCTPSDQVDQVWHLHLLYTKDYWKEFCTLTLGKEIHHGPTKGGSNERNKYKKLYVETLGKYQETFNQNPPKDIWPSSNERFSRVNFRRVSMDDFKLLPNNSKGILKWIFSKN